MNISPIIIFTYRRKIDKLIDSLLKNRLAKESELYIFSDGYKDNIDKQDVLDVRNSFKDIKGFKNIHIIEAKTNKGLANSVIDGVTEIVNRYDKIIVLEDDLIVANNFLDYMNKALDFYKQNNSIWSVSGYTPDLEDCLKNYDKDIYLSLRANSWGWATWRDRWNKIDWKINDWEEFKEDKEAIKKFNLAGNDMFKMLEMQMMGKIDSWAIRWCYNQFRYNTFSVYPKKSKIINIGFDEKGTHNDGNENRWKVKLSDRIIKLEDIKLSNNIVECFAKKYNLQLKTNIGYFLKKYGGYKFIKKFTRYWI